MPRENRATASPKGYRPSISYPSRTCSGWENIAGSRAPVSSSSNSSPDASALFIPRLHEAMTVLGGQLETVDVLQAFDLRQRLFREWRLPFQSVQSHSLQQIAEGNVQVFRQALEHLHKSLLHP